jgi:hypothetical protein
MGSSILVAVFEGVNARMAYIKSTSNNVSKAGEFKPKIMK